MIAREKGANQQRSLASAWSVSLSGWLIIMVATPIVLWMVGRHAFPLLASIGVLVQLFAVLISLAHTWSLRQLVWSSASVFILTWGIEVLGVASGYPFGSYAYTEKLQPQIAGVPLLIPLAWLMMLAPSWGLSSRILKPVSARIGRYYWVIFSALSGLVFTAWDLYLDPQMVSHNLWKWSGHGGYFGVPWINFFGWWFCSSLITMLIRPQNLPEHRLWLIYSLTWVLQAIGLGIFWGQASPALAGFVGMGLFTVWAYTGLRREKRGLLDFIN